MYVHMTCERTCKKLSCSTVESWALHGTPAQPPPANESEGSQPESLADACPHPVEEEPIRLEGQPLLRVQNHLGRGGGEAETGPPAVTLSFIIHHSSFIIHHLVFVIHVY